MHLFYDRKPAISKLLGALASILVFAAPLTAEATPSRVIAKVNDTDFVALPGGTHPLARPQYDKGLVDQKLELGRVQLVLQRSPEQDAALQKFLTEQQDPASPNFHHWLHAAEFGALYGPSDADIAAVTGWLGYHGFSNIQVSEGRVAVEFDATAAQVQEAFHTEMHRYLVNGTAHIANDRNPLIPAALAPVVTGIASLHDFRAKHQSVLGRFVTLNQATHQATPVGASPKAPAAGKGPSPLFNFTDPNDSDIRNEDVAPYDFATIYNLIPTVECRHRRQGRDHRHRGAVGREGGGHQHLPEILRLEQIRRHVEADRQRRRSRHRRRRQRREHARTSNGRERRLRMRRSSWCRARRRPPRAAPFSPSPTSSTRKSRRS